MTLWLVLAAMAVAAVAIVAVPLIFLRGAPEVPRAALDVALFRDQLAELERERASGEIGDPEAIAARREIERRLLAAGHALENAPPEKPTGNRRTRVRFAVVLAAIIAPLAFLLYVTIGTPEAPAYLATVAQMRAEDAARRAELARLTDQIEDRLKEVPDDGEGWALLASAKLRLAKMDDARNALAKARQLLPPPKAAEATARFAQTLAEVSEGQAVSPIRQYANEALSLDPANPRGHMLLALLAMQSNDAVEARKQWTAIIEQQPADSPFVAQAKSALDLIDRSTKQPTK